MVYDEQSYKCHQFCNDVCVQQNFIFGTERRLLPHTGKRGSKSDIIYLRVFDLLREYELVFIIRSIFCIQMYHSYVFKGYCVNNEI